MTIELQLTRIADALEALTRSATLAVPETPPKPYVKERVAEIQKEVGGRTRGATAPVKTTLKVPEPKPAKEEPPADDFLDEPVTQEPAKEVTLDEVRAALLAYRTKKVEELGEVKGKEAAMLIMSKYGGGAAVLPRAGVDHPAALKPEYYAAVLAAATKA